MILKYVGAMPVVSDTGVGFDHTKPDRYTFLNAAVELLEALDFEATATTQHLHHVSGKEYDGTELLIHLSKYCPNLEKAFSSRQEDTDKLKIDLIKRVHENKNLNDDARTAWLNNIELMNSYYYQFITNETAYQCALEALGQEMFDARIEEITFPMFRNYGLVLHDLDYVMQHRKPPIDSVLTIGQEKDILVGKLSLKHK